MKELDLILVRYLQNGWLMAGEPERALFEQFLELPDPDLARYLIAGDPPPDSALASLVAKMRQSPQA
jgi:antitoxin CptB